MNKVQMEDAARIIINIAEDILTNIENVDFAMEVGKMKPCQCIDCELRFECLHCLGSCGTCGLRVENQACLIGLFILEEVMA